MSNLTRHIKESCRLNPNKKPKESLKPVRCDVCECDFDRQSYYHHLRSNRHKELAFQIIDDGVSRVTGAFKNRISSYRIYDENVHISLKDYLKTLREKILNIIQQNIGLHHAIKLNFELFGLYYLSSKENVDIKSFNTKNKTITISEDLYEVYESFVDELDAKASEFQERDSGKYIYQIM